MSEPLPQIERIDWVDSSSFRGWQFEEKKCEVTVINSIGWVINESDTAVTLSAHVDQENSSHHSAMTIPKVSIVHRIVFDEAVKKVLRCRSLSKKYKTARGRDISQK